MTTDHELPAAGPDPRSDETPAPDAAADRPATTDDDLPGAIFRLTGLLARHERRRHRGPGSARGVHRGQGRVLALLSLREPLSQRELGFLLGVRPQSLGELLVKLERAGLVLRTPDPGDRRSMTVGLTDAGRQAAAEASDAVDDDDPFAVLTSEQRTQLVALLDTVIAGLWSTDGDLPRGPRGWHGGGPGEFGPGGFGPGGFGPGGFGPGGPREADGPDGPRPPVGPPPGPRRGRRRGEQAAEMAADWAAMLSGRCGPHRRGWSTAAW